MGGGGGGWGSGGRKWGGEILSVQTLNVCEIYQKRFDVHNNREIEKFGRVGLSVAERFCF